MENNNLTKKEKYLLKKKKKEQDRLSRIRRKKTKKIIKFSLIAILIIAGLSFGIFKFLSREKNSGVSKVEAAVIEYDTGTVSMADGLVKHTYKIKSIGEGSLEIKKIWTSCMCTTARLRVGDSLSSEFGMHSNSLFWSKKIAPGETGYLEVAFDPAFHGPSGTGPISRAIYVSTNDPDNKDIEFLLLADVVE